MTSVAFEFAACVVAVLMGFAASLILSTSVQTPRDFVMPLTFPVGFAIRSLRASSFVMFAPSSTTL